MIRTSDVLVLGAGPAGASAAHACAAAGLSVALVDRARFPRDKICGDALIPDANAAVRRLGLGPTIARHARPIRELRVFAPGGEAVALAGEFTSLPRAIFDELAVRAAVAAGAMLMEGVKVRAPIVESGVIAGARLQTGAGQDVELRAKITVLATGANAAMLQAFAVGSLARSNAAALRAYFRASSSLAHEIDYLAISYDARICPGYGWVFPGPDDTFNVGVGWFEPPPSRRGYGGRSARVARGISLHAMWDTFLKSFPLAERLAREGTQLHPARGAPLRTGLRGGKTALPGLLVVGDAAGFTYGATGEGIGKAMESGLLAADLIREAADTGVTARDLAERYQAEVRQRYTGRFHAYDSAQRWSSHPWVLDLLARRANRGHFVRRHLEALIAETGDPRALFSAAGWLKAMVC